MASEKGEESSHRDVEKENRHSHRPPHVPGQDPAGARSPSSRLTTSDPRLVVDGHTFWRTDANGRPIELTTATGIELDGDRCRWTVSPPGARSAGESVESVSREVRRFMNGVLGEMQKVMHRSTVRPAPKPRPAPAPAIPATAPVPCPLCHGEAWPDCEVCDGAGIVTARQATAWQNGTWGRDEDQG